jgi:uncharacterized protein YjiK
LKNKTLKPQLIKDCGFIFNLIFIVCSFVFILMASCGKQTEDNLRFLNSIEEYDLDIPETSDLCFGATSSVLYTVSDNTSKVYKISTKGKKLAELSYIGNDLEGVCIAEGRFLYVAEERMRKIVKLDLNGNKLNERTIDIDENNENEGLEGIAYAPFNSHFYILNERNPDLMIETDKDLNPIAEYTLSFADDYSGICVDNENQRLWIVSDISETVSLCTMQGTLIESFRIPVYNAEGVAYNPETKKIYVVSDSESKLYVFNNIYE